MSSAAIVLAYGTPTTPADLEPYYTHIRHGRAPSQELLAELRQRYDAIGGRSPMLEITAAQAEGLRAALLAADCDGRRGRARHEARATVHRGRVRRSRRRRRRRHGRMARGYPHVRANAVSGFGLGDYEWLLAFKADQIPPIVDLIRHLRSAEARRHTHHELPFLTGRRRSLTDAVADLP